MSKEKRDRLRLIIALSLITATVLTMVFRTQLAPLAEELICTQVDNQASDAINEAIGEQIAEGEIDYARMVSIQKDAQGNVTAVQTNIAEVNRLKTAVLRRVDEKLHGLSTEELSIPVGSVLLPELFSGQGPFVPVRVVAVRKSDAVFRNTFTSAGINQTLHQITIDIHVTITVLTWSGTMEIAVDSAVLAAETVIVGTVPTTYFATEEIP